MTELNDNVNPIIAVKQNVRNKSNQNLSNQADKIQIPANIIKNWDLILILSTLNPIIVVQKPRLIRNIAVNGI